jgi:hypothetical protein
MLRHQPVGIYGGVSLRAGKELDISTRTRNALIRSVRCLGERGFALLTQRWQTLQHITASPGKIGQIARAALVLVLFEHKMVTRKSLRKPHWDKVRSDPAVIVRTVLAGYQDAIDHRVTAINPGGCAPVRRKHSVDVISQRSIMPD